MYGYVGNRAAQVGAYVVGGAYLVTIIPAHDLWVDANFKESQLEGIVTLPWWERKVSVPQHLSGRCDCSPPRGQRLSAKHAVGGGGDEVALSVEGVVDGGVRGKKFLG